ncbi:MAG: hypothetical protein ACR2H1_11170 [Limisphaerales bacterium]
MSFDLEKILQSKREFRQRLAARPIAEKLAMLDDLRERQLAIRGSTTRSDPSSILNERPVPYRTELE